LFGFKLGKIFKIPDWAWSLRKTRNKGQRKSSTHQKDMEGQITNMLDSFTYTPGSYFLVDLQSAVTIVAIYLIVIFGLQSLMKNKKKFELGVIGPIHNFFLCGLSLAMMLGIIFEVSKKFATIRPDQDVLEAMFCDTERRLTTGGQIFWILIFFYSKYYELLDTVIIVLKKRPLIFLHVYHHCITIILTLLMLDNMVAVQWLAITGKNSCHLNLTNTLKPTAWFMFQCTTIMQ
jgi:hypothetical protein